MPGRTPLFQNPWFYFFAILLALGLIGYGSWWAWHKQDTSTVRTLVAQLQTDLTELETSNWRVQEAELELNFITTSNAENKTEIKAVSSQVSVGSQTTHRLKVVLKRLEHAPAPAKQ